MKDEFIWEYIKNVKYYFFNAPLIQKQKTQRPKSLRFLINFCAPVL